MKTLNILFLTNKVPYPPKDGGSIATLGMIKAFAKTGHKVTVLAMNTKKHHVTPFEIPDSLQSLVTFHLVEVPANISFPALLKNLFLSKMPYNAERFIDKNFKQKLKDLLSSFLFDIIQLEGLYTTPYINTIKKYSSAKIAYRSHNIEYEIWERTVAQSKGFKKIYLKILTSRLKTFETKAINKYDLLVPITNRDLEQLNKLGNTKPSVAIPAGFDIKDVDSKKTPNNLFFIGALDWSPNQEGLLWFLDNCFPSIVKKIPDIELKIAGRNAPQWLIEKLKSNSNINFLGEIDNAQKYILGNGIMIVPLLSGSGMRIKIIEGMMLKKAIVTTIIGCEGINAINEEHIFIAQNSSDFSEHCLSLLQKKDLSLEIGEKVFSFAKENYDNTILIKQLTKFYQQNI